MVALLIVAVTWINSQFVASFDTDTRATTVPSSTSLGTPHRKASGNSRQRSPPAAALHDGTSTTPSPEDPATRDAWMLNLSRLSHPIDMYTLTQANDCKRLPSWRANEKRYIRLQADRGRAGNCIQKAGLNHTQLFALRTVADTNRYSHLQYSRYDSSKDSAPLDEPQLLRLVREFVSQHSPSTLATTTVDDEVERIFSLASIAVSDAFLWKDADAAPFSEVHGGPLSVDELVEFGRLRYAANDSRFAGRLEINPDALDECHFSQIKPLSHVDLDPFSMEGYSLVQFLFEEAFLRHGYATIPVAGTALGSLRHHGMFRGDDDMDMTMYPPAKHLLLDSEWGAIYDDIDAIFEEYGRGNPNFTWFKSNDYRTYRPWYTRNDKKKKLPSFRFTQYEKHIRQESRVCFAQYMTWNTTEKRRLFMTEGCTPNHWFMCLQPATYIYDRHSEVVERHVIQDVRPFFSEGDAAAVYAALENRAGPMVFTAYHRRPAGKICRCKFGFRYPAWDGSDVPSYGLCFDNLQDFVQYWYDEKWCVPSGAVRTRKWSFLKSWND